MPVYVDPIVPWGKSKTWKYSSNCHMFADTLKELHAMAERIGLKRSWFQSRSMPHYDLTEGKRRQAVAAGAVELERDEAVRKWGELGFLPGELATALNDNE